tara:strand:- start:63 stop:518 length:456 start_codon:yes stop_codon:yes gene_type:complete
MKKVIIFFFLICLNSCGYNSIYSSQEKKVSFVEIIYEGDQFINKRISKSINNYKYQGDKLSKKYNLKIYSNKEKNIISKDSEGNPKVFSLSVKSKTVFTNEAGKEVVKNFQKDFSYKNMSSKFKLKKYERDILNDLIFAIIEEIIISAESL